MNVNKILMIAAVQLVWMIPSMATGQSEESPGSKEKFITFQNMTKSAIKICFLL